MVNVDTIKEQHVDMVSNFVSGLINLFEKSLRDVHFRSVFGLKDEQARQWLERSRQSSKP